MQRRLIEFALIALLLATFPSPAGGAVFEQFTTAEVTSGTQRMSVEIGPDGALNFLYLVGQETLKMTYPVGVKVLENELYQFKYARIENGNLEEENVTDKLVYRYQYNLVVDENNVVHTVFVADNYTLYYAKRENGVWSYETLNIPSQWYALSPVIALGENNQPRILYSVILRENATNYWYPGGFSPSIVSRHGLYYQYWNGTGWEIFDVTDNYKYTGRDFTKLEVFNPGMLIENGTVYVAFTSRVGLSSESRLSYVNFPEDPSNVTNILERTFNRAYFARPISIIFTRPTILLDDMGGIYLAVGLLTKNNAAVLYLSDKDAEPEASILEQPKQWSVKVLDDRLSAEVTTMDGEFKDGVATFTWSLRDNFDTTQGRFSYDVFLANITLTDSGEIDDAGSIVTSVTQSDQVIHYSPNILIKDGKYEIYFIEGFEDTYTIETVKLLPDIVPDSGSALAFLGVVSIVVIVIFAWKVIVKRIPEPDVEEEILPHLINLKDSIARDE